jgi:hypothetical protein
MRSALLFLTTVLLTGAESDAFDRMKSLVGECETDFPGFGKMTDSIRLVSNGRAMEETTGSPADNEVSIYSRAGSGISLTHFCAMTPDGHVVRLETSALNGAPNELTFAFRGATNLHTTTAPHMRLVVTTFLDHDHFSEKWTKTENGKDTVLELNWTRR